MAFDFIFLAVGLAGIFLAGWSTFKNVFGPVDTGGYGVVELPDKSGWVATFEKRGQPLCVTVQGNTGQSLGSVVNGVGSRELYVVDNATDACELIRVHKHSREVE